MQSDKVLNLPAGYFGIVLGTIGMGFAWRYASQVWQVSHWLGDGLVILAMIIWGLLTSAFIARLIRFPHSVLAEVRHPVLSSFVSLFPATTMLVAIGFVPWFRPLAVCLFSFGVVVQLAYAAWQTAGLWRGSHPEEATTPGLYLPTVANNFISAMACGALGYTDAAFAMQRTNKVSLIVCSALKKHYRDLLREGNPNLSFIYLKGDFDVIESRLKARKGHFFKTQMLVTQFETLQEPGADETDVLVVDIDQPLEGVVASTIEVIKKGK